MRLGVAAVCRVYHMSVPQGVVGNDESLGASHGERHLVYWNVCALVAVDESHVERYSQSWCLGESVANGQLYLVGNLRPFYPFACEVLQFVVYLEGMHHAALLQSFCHADGAIAAEGAHFEDVLGSYHLHEHFQQPSLQVPACHAPCQQVYVCCPVQAVQVFSFWLYVLQDVVFQLLVGGHGRMGDACRSPMVSLCFSQCFDGKAVGVESEAANHALAGTAYHGMVPERLPLVNVGDMNFHHRAFQRTDAVVQRYAGVGVGSGIEHYAIIVESHFLHLVYQRSFDVALIIRYLDVGKATLQRWQVILERFLAINAWFALSQQI